MSFFRNAKFVQVIATVALFCVVFATTSTKVVAQDPCFEGKALASEKTNGCIWFSAGCLLSGLGVVGAYVIKPDPPMTAVVGKDAAYVAQLTDCYKDEAVGIQTKWAWIGCGAALVPYIIYVVAFAAAASSM
ncbi:MAG: hypothetical protein RL594_300 [Bacteroidota bacterium]|jgi:hypothetical protein